VLTTGNVVIEKGLLLRVLLHLVTRVAVGAAHGTAAATTVAGSGCRIATR